MDAESPVQITERALSELVVHLRARDIASTLDLFADDAVLFGSEADEQAIGRAQLHAFFARLFDRPHTFGWSWDAITARRAAEWIWFVGPAMVVMHKGDGSQVTAPYRLSGVLERRADHWRFVLFNGSEPPEPEA